MINSVYDPLGVAVPAMLEGRKLLQQLICLSKGIDGKNPLAWDNPLPERVMKKWQCWKDSLQDLENVYIEVLPSERLWLNIKSGVAQFFRRESGCNWSTGVP